MLNPFAIFELRFIPALRKIHKRFLVSQSFYRDRSCSNYPDKKYILFTSYQDEGLARIHYKAIVEDQFAAIVDLDKPEHRSRVEEMIADHEKFVLYSSYVKDPAIIKKALDKELKIKIQSYVAKNTDWKIRREQTIRPEVELSFGELYVVMKYGSEKVRVKLEEIEGN